MFDPCFFWLGFLLRTSPTGELVFTMILDFAPSLTLTSSL